MELTKIGLRVKPQLSPSVNQKAENSNIDIGSQRLDIPDAVFIFYYTVDGTERVLNLRRLFEVDVIELTELTMSNLRVQIEQISSIRLTLERSYEQIMEDYGRFKIDYDIWMAKIMEGGRAQYWIEQVALGKLHDLAKSGLKPPTQDDILNTALRQIGTEGDYKERQEKMIRFQRQKSLYEKVDAILNSREFALKTIIDSRNSRREPNATIS